MPSRTLPPVDSNPRLGHADLLTVGDVAAELRVSTSTVHRLIKRGRLRAHALGAEYRITQDDLDDYLLAARERVRTSTDSRTAPDPGATP